MLLRERLVNWFRETSKYLKPVKFADKLVNKLLVAARIFKLAGFGIEMDVNLLSVQNKVSNNGRFVNVRFESLHPLQERYFKLGKLSTTRSVNKEFEKTLICLREGNPEKLREVKLL